MNPPASSRGADGSDNIVLIGPMGAGKSSVARELSRMGGKRWTDTDRLVVQSAGMPITEIFASRGEDGFRRLETAALHSLAGSRGLIVATGGGIVGAAENRLLLPTLGCVVWLTADEDVLFARVSRNDRRPLLQTADPRAALHELLERRRPLYSACADVTVDTTAQTHAAVAASVAAQAQAFFAAHEPART